MGLSLKHVKRIKKEFQGEYCFKKPYSTYVNSCGVSKVGLQDSNASVNEKDDFCISVGLRESLPPNLALPQEYQGVRIFVKVIGEIRVL